MKRVLEDELLSLAERILKLKNRADIHVLKKEAAILYEKLSILAFAELHFGGLKSEISKAEFKDAFSEQFSEIDEESGHYKSPDGMAYNPDPISEPNTEKIKDIVSQMPPESEQVDILLAEIEQLKRKSQSPKPKAGPENTKTESKPEPKKPHQESGTTKKNTAEVKPPQTNPEEDDFKNFGVHFDDLPNFEPKDHTEFSKSAPISEDSPENNSEIKPSEPDSPPPPSNVPKPNLNAAQPEKRSLNDKLKSGIKIGLNDRIAFTKHLFGGNTDDYNRVLSQLNTLPTFEEVQQFIENHVKPDYGQWAGKEAVEERFMAIVERKFEV